MFRFTDIIFIYIIFNFFPRVTFIIDIYLYKKFGLYNRTSGIKFKIFIRFINEGPEMERKRREFKIKKEKFD